VSEREHSAVQEGTGGGGVLPERGGRSRRSSGEVVAAPIAEELHASVPALEQRLLLLAAVALLPPLLPALPLRAQLGVVTVEQALPAEEVVKW